MCTQRLMQNLFCYLLTVKPPLTVKTRNMHMEALFHASCRLMIITLFPDALTEDKTVKLCALFVCCFQLLSEIRSKPSEVTAVQIKLNCKRLSCSSSRRFISSDNMMLTNRSQNSKVCVSHLLLNDLSQLWAFIMRDDHRHFRCARLARLAELAACLKSSNCLCFT